MKVNYSKKLRSFTRKLKEIPEIIAVYYTGSTATMSWDEYSDLDIDIVIRDEDYEKIVKNIPKFLAMLGEIKLCNKYNESDETYAFIGNGYIKVEIDPIKLSNLKPSKELKNIKIAFDKDGRLSEIFKESQSENRSMLNIKELTNFFLDTQSNFIYAVRHFMRGQKLSGVSALSNIGGELFYYLGKIKGMEGYESIRTAEKHLTKKEWTLLEDSKCNSLEKEEFQRAIKSNWEYMKYLENYFEKKIRKKLNLKCNDKEILDLINKTLERNWDDTKNRKLL